MNVDNQVDPLAGLARASLGTGQRRLYILLAVALPQRGGTQTGKPFLAGSPETDCAPLLLYLIAGLLHEGEEGGKVGGLLFKSRVNGGAQLLLEGKWPFPALGPLPIALIFSQSYEAEQKQLEAEVITLRQDIEVQERQNENIEKFIQKAHKYVGIEALDPYALRELVQAIYVEAPDKSSGKRRQSIHIKYDGMGFIPLDELMKGETA